MTYSARSSARAKLPIERATTFDQKPVRASHVRAVHLAINATAIESHRPRMPCLGRGFSRRIEGGLPPLDSRSGLSKNKE